MGTTRHCSGRSSGARAAYTIPEFCFRNRYQPAGLPSAAPAGYAARLEMRVGSELDPHHRRVRARLAAPMQEPSPDFDGGHKSGPLRLAKLRSEATSTSVNGQVRR